MENNHAFDAMMRTQRQQLQNARNNAFYDKKAHEAYLRSQQIALMQQQEDLKQELKSQAHRYDEQEPTFKPATVTGTEMSKPGDMVEKKTGQKRQSASGANIECSFIEYKRLLDNDILVIFQLSADAKYNPIDGTEIRVVDIPIVKKKDSTGEKIIYKFEIRFYYQGNLYQHNHSLVFDARIPQYTAGKSYCVALQLNPETAHKTWEKEAVNEHTVNDDYSAIKADIEIEDGKVFSWALPNIEEAVEKALAA